MILANALLLKSGEYKSRKVNAVDWNEQTKAEEWRGGWADAVNRFLAEQNVAERIDHRSFERQGIDQIPTVHLGVAASAMEKRGIRTERGDMNREIEVSNQKLRQLKVRLVKLQNWLKEEFVNTEPPTLADYIQDILSRKAQVGKSGYSQSLYNLKDAANMLNFLTANKIMDMAGLDEKFKSMIGAQMDIREELKKVERRMATLDEHLQHSGNFKGYRGYKTQYEKLYAQHQSIKKTGGFGAERKAQKALNTANEYHESYRAEIAMYENAEKYLRDVLQGHFDIKKLPPMTKWQTERESLTTERNKLNQRYVSLKDEVTKAEQIRKSVYSILWQDGREQQPRRAQNMEL